MKKTKIMKKVKRRESSEIVIERRSGTDEERGENVSDKSADRRER